MFSAQATLTQSTAILAQAPLSEPKHNPAINFLFDTLDHGHQK